MNPIYLQIRLIVLLACLLKGSELIAADQEGVVAPRLQTVFQAPFRNPPPGWLPTVRATDREALLVFYRSQTELTNKRAVTIALGLSGDASVVKELTNTLLQFRPARPITLPEETVLSFTLEALGFLAREDDAAFAFLTNAINPSFWRDRVSWRGENPEYIYLVFGGRALTAAAKSERPQIDEILQAIRKSPVLTNSHGGFWPPLTGAVVDAAFFRDTIRQKGLKSLVDVYGTEEVMDAYGAWLGTEVGKEWRAWAKEWR